MIGGNEANGYADGTVGKLCILYLQESLFAISLGPEFVITISWLLVGVLLILLARKTNKELSWEQQELLIFGERFARKGARYEK